MSWDGNITYQEHVWHVCDPLVNHQDVEDDLFCRQNTTGDTHENHEVATTEIPPTPIWPSTNTDEREKA